MEPTLSPNASIRLAGEQRVAAASAAILASMASRTRTDLETPRRLAKAARQPSSVRGSLQVRTLHAGDGNTSGRLKTIPQLRPGPDAEIRSTPRRQLVRAMRKSVIISGMDLHAELRTYFGHENFREGQEAVVRALLAGESALALFPTGAGKSLCYQLPAVLLEGTALVVSPLIALMKDQVDALRARGVAAARLDSVAFTAAETQQVYADLRAGKLKLLYVAPERLSGEAFLDRLRRVRISLVAIDEAHCISEWGHNFRPEYLRLARVVEELGLRPVLALTATATPEVAQDICRAFGIAEERHVQTSFHRPNLHLRVTPCAATDRLAVLGKRLSNAKVRPAWSLYVTFQKTAEEVAAATRAAWAPPARGPTTPAWGRRSAPRRRRLSCAGSAR